MNKIGLQLYSVRDHFKTEEEARATFKKLKERGYDEVQTAGCYGFAYDKFREMANDAVANEISDLTVPVIRHIALSTDDIDAAAEAVRKSGVEILKDVAVSDKGIGTMFFRDPEGNILHFISRPKPLI